MDILSIWTILNFWAFIFALFFESALIYINWEVRGGGKGLEMNPVWRKFDKKGHTLLSLIISLMLVVLIGSIALFLNVPLIIGVMGGALVFNLFHDYTELQIMKMCGRCKGYKECSRIKENQCIEKYGIGKKTHSFIIWIVILAALSSGIGYIGYLLLLYLNPIWAGLLAFLVLGWWYNWRYRGKYL